MIEMENKPHNKDSIEFELLVENLQLVCLNGVVQAISNILLAERMKELKNEKLQSRQSIIRD